jgi:hypothetical protein
VLSCGLLAAVDATSLTRPLPHVPLQLINWMLALADGNGAGGAPGQGFKSAGFESFERIWTGQQVCWLRRLPAADSDLALALAWACVWASTP